MDQFGKFQKISSWFDPENPLMDVRNDSGRVTHLSVDIGGGMVVVIGGVGNGGMLV